MLIIRVMKRRIPGFALGILLLFGPSVHAVPLDLAVDLLEEGNWAGVRRECRRVLLEEPGNARAQLLGSVARLRQGDADAGTRETLARLAAATGSIEVLSMAAYELGRLAWSEGDAPAAFGYLRTALQATRSPDLFGRSGCSLHNLLQARPDLGAKDPALIQQLNTCEPLWTPEIRAECRPAAAAGHRATARPGEWVVRFYRSQIRPAIGARCALEPSCSEFFLQASRAHGLLGIPMEADRLVRESSVIQAAERPVWDGERTRYQDPVSAHDYWLKGEGP